MKYFSLICISLITIKFEQHFPIFISNLCFFFYEYPFIFKLSVSHKGKTHVQIFVEDPWEYHTQIVRRLDANMINF